MRQRRVRLKGRHYPPAWARAAITITEQLIPLIADVQSAIALFI